MGTFCVGAQADAEPIKLTWAMGTGDTAPIDNAMVLEELNKMSRELIGVECDIQYFSGRSDSDLIQSGEVFDILLHLLWYQQLQPRAYPRASSLTSTARFREMAPDLYASARPRMWV